MPLGKEIITVGEQPVVDAMTWDQLLEQGRFSAYDRAAVDLLRPGTHDVCEVMFTSGTTGQPKGVMHTQNTLNAAVDCFVDSVCEGVSSPGGTAEWAWLYLSYGLDVGASNWIFIWNAPLTLGGHVVLQDVWDPSEFVDLIEQHQIQISMGATPFLADVLAIEAVENRDLSSWQRFVSRRGCARAHLGGRDARSPCVCCRLGNDRMRSANGRASI